MQSLFGVFGAGPPARELFDRVAAMTVESNPGLTLSFEQAPGIQLGHVSRSFAVRHEPAADRSFYLDGEIRVLDGRETMHGGTSDADLAALANLYEAHGPAIWERLDGSFCLVIRDGASLAIGMDIAGTHAFYWWLSDEVFAFHTHIVDLAPAYPGRLTEDGAALGSFLACGTYPPGLTAYREVHHMSAGQYLTLTDGQVTVRDHFRMICHDDPTTQSTGQLVDGFIDRVSRAVARCWRTARNPVVPLSGGMDSRYLAAEVTRQAGSAALVRTITWGEDRLRTSGDAEIAPRVAAALSVENTWHEKTQRHTADTFARAIYLSSGEGDSSIHYPEDHLFHRALREEFDFGSLFRGDELLGDPLLLTNRAVLVAVAGVAHLRLDRGYDGLLDATWLENAAREQDHVLDAATGNLVSRKPHGRSQEAYYQFRWRRVVAIYNTVKHADIEVHIPFFDRQLLEWIKATPQRVRSQEKELVQLAMQRRFPEVAGIPYATRSNLPDWSLRWRHDPSLARFYREWCARPGWLETIGAQAGVLSALDAAEAAAGPGGSAGPGTATTRVIVGPRLRELAKRTIPGQLYRELTLERRYARNNLPPYLRFARLAVLHGLLGQVERRRAH